MMAKDNRLYARFTLDFPDHPKIAILSDSAFRTLIDATIYSRRLLTDGFLARRLALARWSLDDLQELCANDPDKPSLIEAESGWYIHDYAEQQDTKAEVETRRQRAQDAGRAGGLAKAGRSANPDAKRTAKPAAKRSAKPDAKLEPSGPSSQTVAETETKAETPNSGPVSTHPYVSSAREDPLPDFDEDNDTYELATSERGMSAPVNIGASRLVDKVVPKNAVPNAHKTVLRIKASELVASGETEIDVAECLRIWLTKTELGPHALGSCMSEVYKKRINGSPMSTRDRQFMETQALKGDAASIKTPQQLSDELFGRAKELRGGSR